jgi:hypothetical protein
LKIVAVIGSPHGAKGSTAKLTRVVLEGAEREEAASGPYTYRETRCSRALHVIIAIRQGAAPRKIPSKRFGRRSKRLTHWFWAVPITSLASAHSEDRRVMSEEKRVRDEEPSLRSLHGR